MDDRPGKKFLFLSLSGLELKYRACRDHRGRFAACGAGGRATSEDLYHLPARGQGRRSGGGGGTATAATDGKAAVKAAQEEQRAANAKAAAEKPVVELPRPENEGLQYYRKAAREAESAKVKDEELIRTLEPKVKEMEARREPIRKKAFDYGMTARTRKKYQEQLKKHDDEHDKIKMDLLRAQTLVHGYPQLGIKGHHDENIERYRKEVGKLEAEHAAKGPIRIEYARDQANHPDLIPPGPIQDRLTAYKVGDAKVKAIDGVGKKYEGEAARLLEERSRLRGEIHDGVGEQINVVMEAEMRGMEAHHPKVQARVDAIQGRMDRATGDLYTARRQQHELETKRQAEVAEILKVDDPASFHTRDVAPGFKTSDGPLSPPTEMTRRATDRATEWLGRTTAQGDNGALDIEVGEGQGYRAHCDWQGKYIQAKVNERADVMVHEFGHAIEARVQVGDRKVGDRSLEFLAHRVGDEPLIDMHAKFGNGDPGEMGRKDKFDQVWSGNQEYRAYYTGKDYGGRATEILSMGAQELFQDPIGFVRKDPEYAKFVMGTLDGSLR